jgi:hypothetical protein
MLAFSIISDETTKLHTTASQKIAILILVAMKT